MHHSLLHHFRCPECKQELSYQEKIDHTIVQAGKIACAQNHIFTVKNGVPDFTHNVDGTLRVEGQDTKTVDSFGFEWQWDDAPRTEEDLRFRVFEKPDLPEGFLKGKLVLDVGCGAGTQTNIMARYGATVIGVDLSLAVNSAVKNNAAHGDNVGIARADIFYLPFAEGTFDYVYCEGVLQHTKDPKSAFYSLIPLLKKEGEIFGTFYTRREGLIAPFLFFRKPLRAVLSRLPQKLCWYICWLSVPMDKTPLLKHLLRKTILLHDTRNTNSKATWCLNYDFYGPHAYQKYFRPSEIRAIWNNAEPKLVMTHEELGYPVRGRRI